MMQAAPKQKRKRKKEHESGPDEGIEEAKTSGLTEKTGEKKRKNQKVGKKRT